MSSAVRRTSKSPLARTARGIFAAAALAVLALALVGTVNSERDRNTAHADAARMRAYAQIADLAQAQRWRLTESGIAAIHTTTFMADGGAIADALRLLQMQARGSEAHEVTSLQVSYATALHQAGHGQGRAKLGRTLTSLQATAAKELRTQQESWLLAPGATRLEQAERAASALVTVGGLLVLLRLGRARLRRREPEETSDLKFEELRTQARTDSLTQLGNHRAFHFDLSALIAKRAAAGAHFTLMAIDLDGLKQINDTKGHPAGDRHIKSIVECVKTIIGANGTLYRTGGDEFMALLPNKRNWDALLLANRIEQQTRKLTGGRAVSIGLTESMGLEGRQVLVHQADLALYEAKRTKLSAVTYHPGLATGHSEGSSSLGPSRDQRALASALARAVDAKDNGTRSHSEMVAELTVAMGQRLGFNGHRLERLRLSGLLHDVGKIGVADSILQKAAALAADERLAMTDHVKIGHAILIAAELPTEAEWILHHHERVDGTGYPAGRIGDEIPIESRIIATADAFEAMTGARPYRESISTEDALAELRRKAGTQFDAACVPALADVVADGPPNTAGGAAEASQNVAKKKPAPRARQAPVTVLRAAG
jgi:diguanylate cyclase (GGDEF)-like protein